MVRRTHLSTTASIVEIPWLCLSQCPKKQGSFMNKEKNSVCSGAQGLWDEG